MNKDQPRISDAIEAARRQDFIGLERMALSIAAADPKHAEAHNLLGVAYTNTGRPDLAIRSVWTAHRLEPMAYSYARNLVRLLSNQQRFSEAQLVAQDFVDGGYPKAAELAEFTARVTGKAPSKADVVFEEIYRNNAWSAGSGLGSTEETTRPYRTFLEHFMRANRVRSVVDLGCGDWQFAKLLDWNGIQYIGLDVSATALERAKTAAPPTFKFCQFDAFSDELPAADLFIAKDVFQHWPSREIQQFLPKTDRFKFSLITNGYAATNNLNADIDLGNFRPLDLTAAPFNSAGANVFSFQADDFKMTLLRIGSAQVPSTSNSTPPAPPPVYP
jgi:SAM-dependent methyltransferase